MPARMTALAAKLCERARVRPQVRAWAGRPDYVRSYLSAPAASTASATASTWSSWNASVSAWDATGTAASCESAWIVWNGHYAVSITAASPATITVSDGTWDAWNAGHALQAAAIRETEAQRQARAAAALTAREAQRKRDAEWAETRRVAILRADQLLDSVLNGVQRDQLRKIGGFVVRAQSGRFYRIRPGRSANVDLLDASGAVVRTYCAHPIANVPDGDTMAAQKLMLECDEDAFLRLANEHSPRGPRVPLEALRAVH